MGLTHVYSFPDLPGPVEIDLFRTFCRRHRTETGAIAPALSEKVKKSSGTLLGTIQTNPNPIVNLEEALKIADAVVSAKTGRPLSNVQSAVLQGSWDDRTYWEIADDYHCSPAYLKQDVGPKLWKVLTKELGQKVGKKNFRTVMALLSADQKAKWIAPSLTPIEPDVPVKPPPEAPIRDLADAPDISLFYGREAELAQLECWIGGEGCRVVALLGMGGAGKTSLAAKLVQQVDGCFDCIVWRSLRHAPLLTELLADTLEGLSGNAESDGSDELDAQISQLLDYFRTSRCLLILDGIESILQGGNRAGAYRSRYENYGELFRQLGETRHRSCTLLTSREKPKEIGVLEGGTLPARSLSVRGLPESDALSLIQAKGFADADTAWKSIVRRYGGNPMALKIVTTHIRDIFSSHAAEFLAEIESGGAVFGDLRDSIEQQFDRLTDLEREAIDWFAINLQPISLPQLKADFVLPGHELLETVESLVRRSLLEGEGGKFSPPSMAIDYLLHQFIDCLVEEILSERLSKFVSHAIVKAQTDDEIRERQIREILHPIAAKLLAHSSSPEELQEKFARLFDQLRTEFGNPPGYAGANLIHLCHYFQFDLTRFNFSHLKIWQAYLQDASLQKTDFTGADLSRSVFAKPLGDAIVVALTDNGLLATGDEDGKIWLWHVADGQLSLGCQNRTRRVRSLAFNPQGTRLASGGDDGIVYLWDAATGECLNAGWEHEDTVNCLGFSPDGDTLASGSDDGTVRLWNVNSGQFLHVLSGHLDGVRSIAWSADGRTLASAGNDLAVRLWDAATGQCRRTVDWSAVSGEIHHLWAVAFAGGAEERCLAAASDDRSVQVWDLEAGSSCFALPLERSSLSAVAFSPDGRFFGFADDLAVTVRQIDGETVRTLSGFKSSIASLAFGFEASAERPILAAGSLERAVRVWDVVEGRQLRTLKGHKHQIDSFALSDDARVLAIGTDRHSIELWDAVSLELSNTFSGHRDWVRALALSADGRWLVSGSDDGAVKVWDVATGTCRHAWEEVGGRIQAVAFGGDGRFVASADDFAVTLWSVATGQCLHRLEGHDRRVGSIVFSRDGRMLASGSYDRAVKIWDAATGDCWQTLSGHDDRIHALSFSADGRRLASGSYDRTVKIWDVATGECQKTWVAPGDLLDTLTFAPDGRLLACSSHDDATWQLWDSETGECLHVLSKSTPSLWSARLSADGTTLVGAYSRAIEVWDAATGTRRQTLRTDKPYYGMKISGITGVSPAAIETLKLLGAIEV